MIVLLVGGLAVGGFMLMRNGGFSGLFGPPLAPSPPVVATPPPLDDTPTTPSDTNAIKPDPTVINNTTIINNYPVEFARRYPQIKPSHDTTILFTSFNQSRYISSDDYRRQIVIIVNRMPSRERDFWKDVLRRLDRYISDKDRNRNKPPVIVVPPPKPKPCVQHAMCPMNSHWDTHLCKCVTNSVPLPNTTPDHDGHGGDHLVDGASSNYSWSRMTNTNKINYW